MRALLALIIPAVSFASSDIVPTVGKACLMSDDVPVCVSISNMNDRLVDIVENNMALKVTATAVNIVTTRGFAIDAGIIGFFNSRRSILYFREEEVVIEILWGF
jgi:hypothetical protein